jgi:hypothetical protein
MLNSKLRASRSGAVFPLSPYLLTKNVEEPRTVASRRRSPRAMKAGKRSGRLKSAWAAEVASGAEAV